MFKQKTILILGICLVCLFTSCVKEDFTKPTSVKFSFQIAEDQVQDNFLAFAGGELYLKEIEFEGYRENVENYFFDKEFDPPAFFLLDTTYLNQAMDFDIPQGIYQRINLSLSMEKEIESVTRSTPEAYEESGEDEVSFTIPAVYAGLDGSTTNVLFTTAQIEFEITAKNPDGESTIVLQIEQSSEGTIYFDPAYAFQTLPREFFETAEKEIINNEPTILFSEESYESLYEMILYRLQISAKLIIE